MEFPMTVYNLPAHPPATTLQPNITSAVQSESDSTQLLALPAVDELCRILARIVSRVAAEEGAQ
jgi:hypothetical protein